LNSRKKVPSHLEIQIQLILKSRYSNLQRAVQRIKIGDHSSSGRISAFPKRQRQTPDGNVTDGVHWGIGNGVIGHQRRLCE
jgi:hypothetical protein